MSIQSAYGRSISRHGGGLAVRELEMGDLRWAQFTGLTFPCSYLWLKEATSDDPCFVSPGRRLVVRLGGSRACLWDLRRALRRISRQIAAAGGHEPITHPVKVTAKTGETLTFPVTLRDSLAYKTARIPGYRFFGEPDTIIVEYVDVAFSVFPTGGYEWADR